MSSGAEPRAAMSPVPTAPYSWLGAASVGATTTPPGAAGANGTGDAAAAAAATSRAAGVGDGVVDDEVSGVACMATAGIG